MLSAIATQEHFGIPHLLPHQEGFADAEPQWRIENSVPLGWRDRVLHPIWGVGRVLHARATPPLLAVKFEDAVREMPPATLRQVLTLTKLASFIERTSQITAWAVRKAHDQGTIQPDGVGRFAGHSVHYYDVARVPALIMQLSEHDAWTIGTLVLHSRHGAGRITRRTAQPEIRGSKDGALRLVEFFADSIVVAVAIRDLRRLTPGHAVAKRLGRDRRTFGRLAAARGLYPDFIATHGRVREFYDETRVESILGGWTRSVVPDAWRRGRFVIQAEGEIGRILSRDVRGQVRLRTVQSPSQVEVSEVADLHELVSLRELARRQDVSRYKLQRLLAAVNITPVHQHGKTLYFDPVTTEQALRARLDSECQAVTLRVLAERTGVSESVLGKKVREGCIRTLGHNSAHLIAAAEADRVQQVVKALRSDSDNFESLGICRLHTRGRKGHEVATWDLGAMVQVIQTLSPDRRSILFGQVAWLSEGAGRKRLYQSFKDFLDSIHTRTDEQQARRTAKCLLQVADSLTSDFSRFHVRLLLLASGAIRDYVLVEQRILRMAVQFGCDSKRSHDRFRSQIDDQLLDLLEHESGFIRSTDPILREDTTRGAVLVLANNGKPEVGIVTGIEQQCWDALMRCWHRTVVIRFRDGDRRIKIMEGNARNELRQGSQKPVILLRNAEAAKLIGLLQHCCPSHFCADKRPQLSFLRKVS